VRRLAWLCVVGGVITATSGCSSTLREVRAREPEFRFPGIPASNHFEVAGCIRDVLEGTSDEVVHGIEREPDGMHVIGRPDEHPSAALFDVAIREDAVVAMVAPAATDWTAMLRNAVTACIGRR
jgi:hypothetical protein